MEAVLGIFLVVIITIVAAIFFAAWLLIAMLRVLAGGTRRVLGGFRGNTQALPYGRKCRFSNCGSSNPPDARFCRRCGRAMA